MVQEFESDLAGKFWFEVSNEVVVKMLVWVAVIWKWRHVFMSCKPDNLCHLNFGSDWYSCVSLDKSLNLSECQFSPPKWEWCQNLPHNEIILVKQLSTVPAIY